MTALDLNIIERRQGQRTFEEHYKKLNTQKQIKAVDKLLSTGYGLLFTRQLSKQEFLAVLMLDGALIAVGPDGLFQWQPNLKVRSTDN